MGVFRTSAKPISEMRPSQVEAMASEEAKEADMLSIKAEYDKHIAALDAITEYCNSDAHSPAYHIDQIKSELAKILVGKL